MLIHPNMNFDILKATYNQNIKYIKGNLTSKFEYLVESIKMQPISYLIYFIIMLSGYHL